MAKRRTAKNSGKKFSKARAELAKDIFLIMVGAFITFFFAQAGILDKLIFLIGNPIFASFAVGIFFTSVFTIAPASVILVKLAEHAPFSTVALWGALGAMCGDLLLFFFIRDRFADDLVHSMKPSFVKHILSSFHLGLMKYLSPLLGALLIASPLPDEFGLALMGISRTKAFVLMPISFAMNMLNIWCVVWLSTFV